MAVILWIAVIAMAVYTGVAQLMLLWLVALTV
jgi:hypothetical protein